MTNPTKHRLSIAISLLAFVSVLLLGAVYILGVAHGETRIYQHITEMKIAEFNQIRNSYHDKYTNLVIEKSSAGLVGLYGTVKNQTDRDTLLTCLRTRFENETADEIVNFVELEEPGG